MSLIPPRAGAPAGMAPCWSPSSGPCSGSEEIAAPFEDLAFFGRRLQNQVRAQKNSLMCFQGCGLLNLVRRANHFRFTESKKSSPKIKSIFRYFSLPEIKFGL